MDCIVQGLQRVRWDSVTFTFINQPINQAICKWAGYTHGISNVTL